jgi:ribosomal protein S18 acetylase RimI-like enzyme
MSDIQAAALDARQADSLFHTAFEARAGERFALGRATAAHGAFLRSLLAETLAESVRQSGGNAALLVTGPLLDLQLQAQAQAYRAAHPAAHHYIVSRRGPDTPIGRMLIDWTPPAATLGIDLAVLPDEREGAAGLHLLRAWISTCDRLGRAARLHVRPENPARRLYRRLGFVETDAAAFPIPMLREPAGARRPVTSGTGKCPASR